ncbi:hypothetical protein LINPERPRIM_LOCUS3331 [Linum perenne]
MPLGTYNFPISDSLLAYCLAVDIFVWWRCAIAAISNIFHKSKCSHGEYYSGRWIHRH